MSRYPTRWLLGLLSVILVSSGVAKKSGACTAADLLKSCSLGGYKKWCVNVFPAGFAASVPSYLDAALSGAKDEWTSNCPQIQFSGGSNISIGALDDALGNAETRQYRGNPSNPCEWTSMVVTLGTMHVWSATCNDSTMDAQTILLHELGHVIGFDESTTACTSAQSVMWNSHDKSYCVHTLRQVDIDAVNLLYPPIRASRSNSIGPYPVTSNCEPPSGGNPVVDIDYFEVSGNQARWKVLHEWETYGYVVEGFNDRRESPVLLAEALPGDGDRMVDLPTNSFRYIQLVEIEEDQRRKVIGRYDRGDGEDREVTKSPPKLQITDVTPRPIESGEKIVKPPLQTTGQPQRLVVYTRSEFVEILSTDYYFSTNYVEYWESRGYEVIVKVQSPTTVDIVAEAALGTKYFHIIGAAGEILNSSLWESSEYWTSKKAAYIRNGVFDQNRSDDKLIPTLLIDDSAGGPRNTARDRPFILTDQPYGDLDGDGVPDVVVTRWPVPVGVNNYELQGSINTMLTHGNNLDNRSMSNKVGFLVGDHDHINPGPDPAYVDMSFLMIRDNMNEQSLGQSSFDIRLSDTNNFTYRNQLTAIALDTHDPDLVVIMSTSSQYVRPGQFFDTLDPVFPWSLSLLDAGTLSAMVIAASCNGANFTAAPNDAVCVEFTQGGGRGSVAWVGPTGGSYNSGNHLLTYYLVEEL